MLAGCLAGFSALALRVLAPLRKNILLKVFEDRRVLPRLKGVALAKIDEPSRLRFVRACKQIFPFKIGKSASRVFASAPINCSRLASPLTKALCLAGAPRGHGLGFYSLTVESRQTR